MILVTGVTGRSGAERDPRVHAASGGSARPGQGRARARDGLDNLPAVELVEGGVVIGK
jgi:hypothetical protein